MKLLKILGWLFVPYIMVIVRWKKLKGAGRVFGLVWAVIALVVAINAGSGDNKPQQAAPAVPAKEETKDAPKEEAPKKEEKAVAYKIGDAVRVGDVTFTISGKSTDNNVGGEFGVNASGTFLILDVAVKNEGKEPLLVSESFFQLKQGDSTFSSDANANIYANEAGKSFLLNEINPGLELKGKIVFDVAEPTAPFVLQVQSGFFGTKTAEIQLQ